MPEQILEIVELDQYPEINWSRDFTNPIDHDPDDTFGITQAHFGSKIFRVNSQHKLVISETDFYRKHSQIRFGRPGNTSFSFNSEQDAPFGLDDHVRINTGANAVRDILIALHQIDTTSKVERIANQLMQAIQITTGFVLGEHIEEVGIIEQLVNRYKSNISKERILTAAEKLQELQIPLLFEGNSIAKGYVWTTKELSQYFETGYCPPLPISDYIF